MLLPVYCQNSIPQALQNEQLINTVFHMAETVGQHNFALQQQAISNRIDHRPHCHPIPVHPAWFAGFDELTPPDLSVEMAALLPNCDLKLLEATGHLSTMEAPEAVLLRCRVSLKEQSRVAELHLCGLTSNSCITS